MESPGGRTKKNIPMSLYIISSDLNSVYLSAVAVFAVFSMMQHLLEHAVNTHLVNRTMSQYIAIHTIAFNFNMHVAYSSNCWVLIENSVLALIYMVTNASSSNNKKWCERKSFTFVVRCLHLSVAAKMFSGSAVPPGCTRRCRHWSMSTRRKSISMPEVPLWKQQTR